MGSSTNGILVYGYDFGGGDGDLKVAEAKESASNPYGYFKTSWWDDEADEPDEDDGGEDERLDLFDRMTQRLYESIPDAPAANDSWDRAEVVKKSLGVWFEDYCSGSYPMRLLVTHERTVYRGDTVVIDPAELGATPAREEWDAKLAHALSVLEVTPDHEGPRWLMASYWGN